MIGLISQLQVLFLFIIYINDMPDTIRSMCKLFADDSKLYLTIKSRNDQEIIQSDFFKLCDWSKEWLMPFNIAKCKAIGGFRNSQSDVIFAHAHIRGRQRFVQLYGICVKCGFIF